MFFLSIIQQKSRLFYIYLLILGIVNTALNLTILMVISTSISKKPLPFFPEYDWAVFIGAIVLSFVFNMLFQTYMIKVTNDILFDFELSVLQKLRISSYESFQKLGGERVYTAINDTRVLGGLAQIFTHSLNAFIIVTCGLGYLFYVSMVGGFAVVGVMLFLLILYTVRNKAIISDLNKLRDLQNIYHRYLGDLLNGFRETKMNPKRSENMYGKYITKNRYESKKLTIATTIKYLHNELIGSYSWYVVLGIVIFVLSRVFDMNIIQTSVFLVTILYLMGPIATLISLVPTFSHLQIAFQRINDFDNDLDSSTKFFIEANEESKTGIFESIKFEEVSFEYYDTEKQKTFAMGPFSLELIKGEIVFITGGNGSGKSTFVNLLTGLYKPISGNIYINDELITNDNYVSLINQISAIFSNNHLFSENYDDYELHSGNKTLKELISLVKLEEIVKIDDEKKLIDARLSKGQQKRLSLIYALLEDKPMLVLDEWAAEQDPEFRSYFYRNLLPKIKQSGKTIIAVTHDDKYFLEADRIIKFDFGKILSDEEVQITKENIIVA